MPNLAIALIAVMSLTSAAYADTPPGSTASASRWTGGNIGSRQRSNAYT